MSFCIAWKVLSRLAFSLMRSEEVDSNDAAEVLVEAGAEVRVTESEMPCIVWSPEVSRCTN